MSYETLLEKQKIFFKSHSTKSLDFRKAQLKKLKILLESHQDFLIESIYKDFGKSKFDTILTELAFVKKDIDYYIKHLNSLAKQKKVRTNLANLPGSSKIYMEPLGNILVIGAWNYPYQLSLSPLVAAIAAGNTCILKPSEIAFHASQAMAKIINENFQADFILVVEGGVAETTELLKQNFDKIFFTGSTSVGKIVYEAAAKNLTPVTLELGGKSPAVVTKNANLDVAAKRIVWGKFLNAGQTCVATDYILVENSVKDKLIENLKKCIQKFDYKPGAAQYTQIINDKNFTRLTKLIVPNKVIFGGETDAQKRYIAPTLMDHITWDDDVMKEEIFGPLLPILSYKKFEDALEIIGNHEKPLAAYLFSNDEREKELFTKRISFGGGCINDTVMHLGNDNLPFGGVGHSGIGNYHGKFGFECFSHQKSILSKTTWGEPNLKYPPYREEKLKWIERLI